MDIKIESQRRSRDVYIFYCVANLYDFIYKQSSIDIKKECTFHE